MTNLVHADLFFFVTTIFVVVLTVGTGVAFYYCWQILRDVREIVARARHASQELEEDFENLRASVTEEGRKVRATVDIFINGIRHLVQKNHGKKHRTEKPPEVDH